jgi:hypothetical protein
VIEEEGFGNQPVRAKASLPHPGRPNGNIAPRGVTSPGTPPS